MQKSQNYNIFQEITIEINQECQAVKDESLKANFSRIFWLVSLKKNENYALSYIHLSPKITQNFDNKDTLSSELRLLENTVLPQGCVISGVIVVRENLDKNDDQIQQLTKNLVELKNDFTEIISNNFYSVQITDQCIYSYKEWKENVECQNISQNNESTSVNLVKYSEINDILKQYISFGTYFSYKYIDEYNNNKIQDVLKNNISKNIIFGQVQGKEVYLPANETYKTIQELSQQEENTKQKKPKKSKQSNKVQTPSQILKEIIDQETNKLKSKASELSKNCPDFVKLKPIEILIHLKNSGNQESQMAQVVDVKKTTDKTIQIDHISYFNVSDISEENCLEFVGKHILEFQKRIDFIGKSVQLKSEKEFQNLFYQFQKQTLCQGGLVTQFDKNYLHRQMHLQQLHPFIRDQNRVQNRAEFGEFKEEKLRNPERYLATRQSENSIIYKVFGDYVFHHYMQDGFNDKGWGCAYRSCMSVVSWFIENKYVSEKNVKIPSIPEIQKMLIEMGDKEASFLNSSQWIGAFEVSFILQKLIDIDCKIIHLSSGNDINTKLSEFKEHFQTEGTPIMFGGDQYAYTLMGIDYNEDLSEARYLILDPHYVGSDEFRKAADKNGISWKKADLFKDTFYNFCCPVRPKNL